MVFLAFLVGPMVKNPPAMQECVCVCVCVLVTQLCVSPWTVTHQAPLPMGFSRQKYWSELPFPSPGNLPDPGIEPESLTLQAVSLPSESLGKPPHTSFSTLHIYVLIYNICFNVSDLLHSVTESRSIHISTSDLILFFL